MEKEKMVNGRYEAVTTAGSVYEKEGKSMVAFEFLVGDEHLRTFTTLFWADGKPNTKLIKNTRDWSGWDGIDPYWLRMPQKPIYLSWSRWLGRRTGMIRLSSTAISSGWTSPAEIPAAAICLSLPTARRFSPSGARGSAPRPGPRVFRREGTRR